MSKLRHSRSSMRAVRTPTRQVPPPSSLEHTFDKWLQRASHIAQVALVAITVFTIYYTVIPLYGKALVDEQIAQKEIELARARESLDKLYVNARHYAVAAIVQRFTFGCIFGPPDTLMRRPSRSSIEQWDRQRLNLDRSTCLSATMENMSQEMATFRPGDAEIFRRSVKELGSNLEALRAIAQRDYKAAEAEARRNPQAFVDESSSMMKIARELRPQVSDQVYQSWILDHAISRAREAAIHKLTDASSKGIRDLYKINWQDTALNN